MGPGLDAGEVEDGVAGGGAGPYGVGGAESAEADEAGGKGGGGGGEKRLDLGEIGEWGMGMGMGIGGEMLEVGGEDGVLEGGGGG